VIGRIAASGLPADREIGMRAILGIAFIMALLFAAYSDLMLWVNRRDGVPVGDIVRVPRRWLDPQLYTKRGNLHRRNYLRAIVIALVAFLAYQLLLS
jgi:hypothetical protein